MIKKLTTGKNALEKELPLFIDDDWADAPLTEDEKAQIAESGEDFQKGEYLTLSELVEGL